MRFVCRWAPLERSATRPQLIIRSAVWETLRYKHTQHWKIRLTEEFTFHHRRHLNAWPQGNDRVLCVTGNTLKQKIQKCLKGSGYSHRWLSICYFLIFVFYLLQSETASGDIRLKAQILILEEQRREVSGFYFFKLWDRNSSPNRRTFQSLMFFLFYSASLHQWEMGKRVPNHETVLQREGKKGTRSQSCSWVVSVAYM